MDVSLIDAVLLAAIAYLVFMVSQLSERIKGMKNSLNQMKKQMDLPEDPINDELRELVREGKDVKAIKQARETLGLSLLEGKEYVDALKEEHN